MKVIICGAGKFTRHLLSRLGDRWRITVVDLDESRLKDLPARYPIVEKAIAGDASSPVLLDDVDLASADYVLVLTNNDKVNLSVARYAREKGVRHIMALNNDEELEEKFRELDVYTLATGNVVGSTLFHYLQDPRVNVFPVAKGRGEIVEVEVLKEHWLTGMSVGGFEDAKWRIAGIFRGGDLLAPDHETVLAEGDRLILMGKRDFFRSVCTHLACAHVPFPMPWGSGMLLILSGGDEAAIESLIEEAMYLALNTRVAHVVILRHENGPNPRELIEDWRARFDIRVQITYSNPLKDLPKICREENIGLVVLRPLAKSFFKALTSSEMMELAHSLPCPMLVSRRSMPYGKILVPFTRAPRSELALETAIDVAEEVEATVDAAVVREPDFIHNDDGQEEGSSTERFKRVRELSHIRKISIGEVAREGNPVRELTALAADYDLMVVGSSSDETDFFSPNIGELLTERTPCSVLVVARAPEV